MNIKVRRGSLSAGASLMTLLLLMAPVRAEQQLIEFAVYGAYSNDVTNPAFGGPYTGTIGACCATYYGPADLSFSGGISEAAGASVGVAGTPVYQRVSDAYDGYGGLGFRQGGNVSPNFGGLTVTRQVDTTHGPGSIPTPITATFAAGGVYNAARWVETISNTTANTITGSLTYLNNLGSDFDTAFVASSSGNVAAQTGNLYLVSREDRINSLDPVITHIFGNNAYTLNSTMKHSDGSDVTEWQYSVSLAPGETRKIVLFNVLTADINFSSLDPASDIALGVQLANLITNNGQAIAADSLPFTFFSDLSRDDLKQILNYDFVGLTLDTSRPYFIETDYAMTHGPVEFDGGTLRPTGPMIIGQDMAVHAAGGTIDGTNGNLTLTGALSGAGSMTFAGTNKIILTGANSFGGGATVEAGTLIVGNHGTGSLDASVQVHSGATLGGTGTIGGNVNILSGGFLSPGNSIGTLTINGDLVLQPGSTMEVEIAGNGGSDLVNVSGVATIAGAHAVITAIDPETSYQKGQTYSFITAAGGIDGQFADITSRSAFLNFDLASPAGGNAVTISLKDDVSEPSKLFTTAANTPNQLATAGALGTLAQSGPSLALYNSLLMLTDGEARAAFDQLSGEAYASAKGVLIDQTHFTRDAVTSRLQQAFGGTPSSPIHALSFGPAPKKSGSEAFDAVAPASIGNASGTYAAWGYAFGSWGKQDGNGHTGELKSSTGGFITGLDGVVYDNWRLGLLAGYSHTSFHVDDRTSSGSSDNYTLGAYAGTEWGLAGGDALAFRSGLGYTWHNLEMERRAAFPGFSDHLNADYDAGTFQAFGELAYKTQLGKAALEPYANLAYVRLKTDGFDEQGLTAAALTTGSDTTDTTFSTLGFRASTDIDLGSLNAKARADIGWRHAYGDVTPVSTASFLGSSAFTVAGAPIAKDVATVEAGLDFQISQDAVLGVSYNGQFGSGAVQNGVNAKLSVSF
ncbi:autotransporter domain-containing protein [Ochrobactrum sp. Q0168]|uniref:autotransporter family protein n=1 Tax=Ochrobactrum sp. Q0168 TaxID=2793241 RepID=UPI0018EBADEA|nr:autotransporter domain-containing protein [Ochrobactrum sp. Q0168]